MVYDVFISYSRKDSEIAGKIYDALRAEGIQCFIDLEGISGGADFPTVLASAITDSKMMLFIGSKNSYASEFTQKEITYAINNKGSEFIFPLMVDNSELPLHLEFLLSNINQRYLGPGYRIAPEMIEDVKHKLQDPHAGETIKERERRSNKKVVVRTSPDNASISVDSGTPVIGIWEGSLLSGEHTLHIVKNGYATEHSVFNVVDDLQSNQLMEINVSLQPQFPKLVLEVLPEEGFTFGSGFPTVTINSNVINLNSPEILSYYDNRDIKRFHLYADGTIPVNDGTVQGVISAPNFENLSFEVSATNGEVIPLTCRLKPLTGYLTLVDSGNAQGARIMIDGELAGNFEAYSYKRMVVGPHSIVLLKDGFLPEEDVYEADIKEGINFPLTVKMQRYTPYVFTSSPSEASVTIDGVFRGGNYNYLPALSVLFLNWEVRTGIYVTDFFQVNALGTYAWYPNVFKAVAGFSYVTGHDVFVGAEIGSRIPYLNVSIRAGMQMYPGGLTLNAYDTSRTTVTTKTEDSYISQPMDLPSSMFVVTLGITLGNKDSRGEGTFRLGHIF